MTSETPERPIPVCDSLITRNRKLKTIKLEKIPTITIATPELSSSVGQSYAADTPKEIAARHRDAEKTDAINPSKISE